MIKQMINNTDFKRETRGKETPKNFLNFKFPTAKQPPKARRERTVIRSANISKKENEAILNFYDALVPQKEFESIDYDTACKNFPSFGVVDIDMIRTEAFPAFEKTIGEKNFAKVKQYFGIGCKQNQKIKDIDSLIQKLRTIENAQFYISSFKELIKRLAKLLIVDDDEGYTDLEKAKLVRLYAVIFCGGLYFAEDYRNFSGQIAPDTKMAEKNDKMGFYPEELFSMYLTRFPPNKMPETDCILYCQLCWEIVQIKDAMVIDSIFKFAELYMTEKDLFSVNVANPYQTFKKVRELKRLVHKEPIHTPVDIFGIPSIAQRIDLGALYAVYKILELYELSELKQVQKPIVMLEPQGLVTKMCTCYEVTPGNYVTGELERQRYIRLIRLLASSEINMYLKESLKTGKPFKQPKKYNLGQFISALKFVNEAMYVNATSVERDFEIADTLIKMDKEKSLIKYARGEMPMETLKAKLGIDTEFEKEFFGVVDVRKIVENYAAKKGYEIDYKDENLIKVIDHVFIANNAEHIAKYDSGELSEEKFEKAIGLLPEFAEMFFDLRKVDVEAIEEKLIAAKKSTIGNKKLAHNLRMIVLLYTFLIDNNIGCGKRMRAIKRRKDLKPQILLERVA